jgi:arylsulfatase A
LFGKWHNGEQYPTDPVGQGFQEFFGFKTGHLNNYFDTKLIRNFSLEDTRGYVPDVLTDETIRFMQNDGPFFCMLTYNTPHAPFQLPDKYFNKYKSKGLDDKTAAVYGMVENLDDNVARILASLKDSGKEDNTIVIFMTDNGPNGVRYNGGFKGIKAHVDEGGVRVPFFIRYPEQGIESKVIEQFAAHIDVLPTVADLVKIQIPDSLEIHGRSLLPLLINDDKGEDRFLFTHQVPRAFDTIPGAVRSNQYLLTLYPKDTALYDLLRDPFQHTDLSKELPEIAGDYINRYKEWFEQITKNGVVPPLIQVGYDVVPEVEFPAPECEKYGGLTKGGIYYFYWHSVLKNNI